MQERDLIADLSECLNSYVNSVQGVESIFMATLDGHVILKCSINDDMLEGLSPISGSLISLAESISNLIYNQSLHENISIMDNSIYGLFKMHDKENSLFLGVICNRIMNIAKMINYAKHTIKELNLIINSAEAN